MDTPVAVRALEKAQTGIDGFDEVTMGGLPKGRPTLVCGSAGCGKTVFAMEFLIRGALQFDEPGVFVAFEENIEDLATNVVSLGFDLQDLERRNLLRLDHVIVDRSEIEESGAYDLEGLFIRLGYLIDQIGAKRVVIDTVETIFSGFSNAAILRSELQRLFLWLKERGVTAVVTGERGDGQLTRQGLEEYVSDCVVLLDHRVVNEVSTRRLRIVKYRGSVHGTNEYPFLIDKTGFVVLPITSMGLKHGTSTARVSSGIEGLDEMLDGKGYYRGSSILVSGTAGTGKSSLSAYFADATCRRGEKCVYFALEESPEQIVRNMRSIGLDLQPWIDEGLLIIHSTRPMHHGLELHLATMQALIKREKPASVVLDPISNLGSIGSPNDISSMLIRFVDFLKNQGITGHFVNLAHGGGDLEKTESGLSSLMDTWVLLQYLESNGERNRAIYVLKARGMNHSNQIREFIMGSDGIRLREALLSSNGSLMGSARVAQEGKERVAEQEAQREARRTAVSAERKRRAIEAQIMALQAELDADENAAAEHGRFETDRRQGAIDARNPLAVSHRAEAPNTNGKEPA